MNSPTPCNKSPEPTPVGSKVNKAVACRNCASKRRPVYRTGFCTKCYSWTRKIKSLEKQLEKPGWAKSILAKHGIDEANRVLEEYAWRERPLNEHQANASQLESLINTVAAECRSTIGFAFSGWLDDLDDDARICFYNILLEIVENIPARRPRFHN